MYQKKADVEIAGSFPDEDLLDDLKHGILYATAAYGWKLELATAGRLHRGDLSALVKMTNIDPEDVVKVNKESRANLPVRNHLNRTGFHIIMSLMNYFCS